MNETHDFLFILNHAAVSLPGLYDALTTISTLVGITVTIAALFSMITRSRQQQSFTLSSVVAIVFGSFLLAPTHIIGVWSATLFPGSNYGRILREFHPVVGATQDVSIMYVAIAYCTFVGYVLISIGTYQFIDGAKHQDRGWVKKALLTCLTAAVATNMVFAAQYVANTLGLGKLPNSYFNFQYTTR